MQPFGFLISLILHTLILLAVIFWPVPVPEKIEGERYLISMVIGEMGGENLPSPVAGVRPPKDKTPSVMPEAKPAAEEAPKQASNAATPVQEKPQELPDAKPIPKKPEEKPEPPKEIAQAPQPKPAEKPKQEQKKEDKKPPQNKPAKNNSVKDALQTAQKQNQKASSSALDALAELEQMAGGGGGTGSGNGGGGIYDVYAGQVILAVQPNWSMPTYSRQNLVVQVRIRLDIAGTVMSAEIVKSSGRADFDASAVNAVLRTKVLPKPPTKEQQDLIISFNSLELAGN